MPKNGLDSSRWWWKWNWIGVQLKTFHALVFRWKRLFDADETSASLWNLSFTYRWKHTQWRYFLSKFDPTIISKHFVSLPSHSLFVGTWIAHSCSTIRNLLKEVHSAPWVTQRTTPRTQQLHRLFPNSNHIRIFTQSSSLLQRPTLQPFRLLLEPLWRCQPTSTDFPTPLKVVSTPKHSPLACSN